MLSILRLGSSRLLLKNTTSRLLQVNNRRNITALHQHTRPVSVPYSDSPRLSTIYRSATIRHCSTEDYDQQEESKEVKEGFIDGPPSSDAKEYGAVMVVVILAFAFVISRPSTKAVQERLLIKPFDTPSPAEHEIWTVARKLDNDVVWGLASWEVAKIQLKNQFEGHQVLEEVIPPYIQEQTAGRNTPSDTPHTSGTCVSETKHVKLFVVKDKYNVVRGYSIVMNTDPKGPNIKRITGETLIHVREHLKSMLRETSQDSGGFTCPGLTGQEISPSLWNLWSWNHLFLHIDKMIITCSTEEIPRACLMSKSQLFIT